MVEATTHAPKMTTPIAKPEAKPSNGNKDAPRVYVYGTEAALKSAMAEANADKKVPFGGYKVELKGVKDGTHFVMGYSPREAMGQLLASLGVEAESVEAPARTVSAAVDKDPTLSEETRKAIKALLERAAPKK